MPPSAIHGLGFDKSWEIVEQSETAVTMRCELRGLGWPFGGRALQTLTLGVRSLELELEVGGYTRAGPAGLGWHPWFTRPPSADLELCIDAAEVLVLDADLIPTGQVRPVSPIEDLRSGPPVGERRLDHVYIRARSPAIVRWHPAVQWFDGDGFADLLRSTSLYRRLDSNVREPLLDAIAERIRTQMGDRASRRYLSVLRVGQRAG